MTRIFINVSCRRRERSVRGNLSGQSPITWILTSLLKWTLPYGLSGPNQFIFIFSIRKLHEQHQSHHIDRSNRSSPTFLLHLPYPSHQSLLYPSDLYDPSVIDYLGFLAYHFPGKRLRKCLDVLIALSSCACDSPIDLIRCFLNPSSY